MIFETLGAVNVLGEEDLRQLFRFTAKRLGRLECRAISSDQLRNLFSIVLMVASSLTM